MCIPLYIVSVSCNSLSCMLHIYHSRSHMVFVICNSLSCMALYLTSTALLIVVSCRTRYLSLNVFFKFLFFFSSYLELKDAKAYKQLQCLKQTFITQSELSLFRISLYSNLNVFWNLYTAIIRLFLSFSHLNFLSSGYLLQRWVNDVQD